MSQDPVRMRKDPLTAIDALKLVGDRVQWCRENGETDLRGILATIRGIQSMIDKGASREEILISFADDEP